MFKPRRIIFEKGVLETNISKNIIKEFGNVNEVEIINLSNNRVSDKIPGDSKYDKYREGKRTLVIGKKKSLKFQSCKPSAHYQLPLLSGCIGQCEYCYLNTRLSEKPFLKVHVNIDEILEQAKKYIEERKPNITIFEGSATSDPVPVEPYTHSLRKVIEFFSEEEYGRFRFVTKYNDIDGLLEVVHNNHTEIRFSLNTDYVINSYEHHTSSCDKRIEASVKLIKSGYPVGFLIAPVFIYPNWKKDYHDMLTKLKSLIPKEHEHPITFEIISHRYTTTAKNVINNIFPENTLPMDEDRRTYKFGQFGYGKYIYDKDIINDIKIFFSSEIETMSKDYKILYII